MTTGKETARQDKGFLQRLLRYINLLEDSMLVLLLMSMIGIAISQIILRNIWDTGFAWGDPLLRIMVLWLGLFGAMVATRQDNHISIDLLTRYLPDKHKRITNLVSNVFTLTICAVVAYHAGRFVMQDRDDAIIAFSGLPAWWFELILPVGFAVMAIRYAVHCIDGFRGRV